MVNLVAPDLDAVNISPTPVLSITNPAKDVLAAIDAAEVVPWNAELPVTLRFAEDVVVPPMRRSRVELPVYTAPNEEFHHDPPFAVGRIPETSDEARLTVDEEERTPPVLFYKTCC